MEGNPPTNFRNAVMSMQVCLDFPQLKSKTTNLVWFRADKATSPDTVTVTHKNTQIQDNIVVFN